ncbi:LysR family transcriptional regulator [Bordetella petrii]|uniref:LysR family transcriptional regulator n=1 Tax=Bordetella petrii TaxID=94624 RepID=UPI001E2FA6AC|nr:LysR family transcriptional regulator [Bordetella petrii]MCD0502826.1 LysR family transcriptional regulator [Bordetella petrii]
MIKLTIKQLAAIKELAHTRSFTMAAAHLHTTQSNLSNTIQEAETLLGVRLFDRTTKSVVPTAAGLDFAQALSRVLGDLESQIDNVQAEGRLARGTLAVGVTPLLSSTLVPELLAEFNAHYPKVELRLEDAPTAELMTLLERRDIELAIGTFKQSAPQISTQVLFDDKLVALSHPALKLPRRITWEALCAHRLVSIVSHSSVGRIIEHTLWSVHQRRVRSIIQSHHWLTVMSLTHAMKAACIAPQYALASHYGDMLRRSDLIAPEVQRTVSVATLKDRELSAAAAQFLAMLRQRLRAPVSR